jgi:hypothetical protein
MAAVLRASSSGLMMMSIIPSSSSAVSLNYMAANYGVNWSPASSNYLMAPGSGLNVFTGPLSVGDIFRMRVVGNPGVVTVERSTGGGPFASVSSLGNGNVVRTEAQGIISGSPGVSGMRASNAHYIYDFVAGDFQPSVLPPTPPTGPQGAFTLRTT